MADRLTFFKLEIAANRQLLIDLKVSGLPSFLFFANGQKTGVLAGSNTSLDDIRTHCEKLLGEGGPVAAPS